MYMLYMFICYLYLAGPTMKSPSATKVTPERDSSAATVTMATKTGQVVAAKSDSYSKTTHQITTESITATQEASRASPRMTIQPKKTTQLGRNPANASVESSGTGKTLIMSQVVLHVFIYS